jgi:hypothetical protein
MSEENIVACPHCNQLIIIEKINCAIFRHGIFKESGKQINPHSTKDLCEYYIREKIIYGCGKPFKVILLNNELKTEICDYI